MCIDTLRKALCKDDFYQSQLSEKEDLIAALNGEIETLKSDWDTSTMPAWLNDRIVPYQPVMEIEGERITLRPQDIYMECDKLRKIALPLRDLEHEQKLMKLCEIVINGVTYKPDIRENWLPPIVTLERGKDDCEGTTNLFITLGRIAHVPAAMIWNGLGYYYSGTEKYGHSFVVAQHNNGLYYVYETTLTSLPKAPKLLFGSNYDVSWGMANNTYSGVVKTEYNKATDGKVQI